MPRTLSGLVSAEFDSIDVFHSVLVRGSPGQVQTVLTSDGVGCDRAPVTLDANAVDTLQIKDDAVIGTKIKDNAVTNLKILDGAVTNLKTCKDFRWRRDIHEDCRGCRQSSSTCGERRDYR